VGRALQAIIDGLPWTVGGAQLSVDADLPYGVGLGSSAALAVAVIRALATLQGVTLADDDVAALANVSEAIFHDRPSGVDVAAATRGALMLYSVGATPRIIEPPESIDLVLALVEPAPLTREMVGRVRQLRGREPEHVAEIMDEIERLVLRATGAIESGDWPTLGSLFDANHHQLVALGVSTPRLDAACRAARNAGALGAKLTGAGGGGALIALAPNAEHEVREALENSGAQSVFSIRVTGQRLDDLRRVE
jgi:mevalonate kinase